MKAFQCKMCGSCCYGKGGIFVQRDEIERIAGFLRMVPESFMDEFCRKKNDRSYIETGLNKSCIFYDDKKHCLIHPVKPRPCVLWPFYPAILKDEDTWDGAKDACPGINPHCSFKEFVRQSKQSAPSHTPNFCP